MGLPRVYWKELRNELEDVSSYIGRWSPKLQENLTPTEFEAVVAVNAAILTALAAIPENEPTD